jgi:hypothetical protein
MAETKIIIELTRNKAISDTGSALPDAAHDAYYLAKEIPAITYKGTLMGDKWAVTAIRCEQPVISGSEFPEAGQETSSTVMDKPAL